MTPSEFKKLLHKTRRLTRWDSTGKCFGHIHDLEEFNSEKKIQDRIYEFYCLLRILEDLGNNYTILLIENPNGKKIFPEAPGKKENYCYFSLTLKSDSNKGFQICFGTKVGLSGLKRKFFAPDISFQKLDSSLNPKDLDLLLIQDAKYKFNSIKSLSTTELQKFMHWVDALKVQNAAKEVIYFTSLKDLIGNCLITNGAFLKGQEDYCKEFHVKQVSNFGLDVRSRFVVG